MTARSTSTETGTVVLAVLYGLSVFSALTLSVLTNDALEKALRESSDPDLHLVLYVRGERTPEITGRVNLPTLWRQTEGEMRKSIQFHAAAPLDMDPLSSLPAGWSYTVDLPDSTRICCDGGDNACEDPTALLRTYEGSVTPVIRPLETAGVPHRLEFDLSAFDLADNLDLDPNVVLQPGFPMKALRIPAGAQTRINDPERSDVSCSLRSGETTIATGRLQLSVTPASSDVSRVSSGTVQIEYQPIRDRN